MTSDMQKTLDSMEFARFENNNPSGHSWKKQGTQEPGPWENFDIWREFLPLKQFPLKQKKYIKKRREI